MGDAAVAFLVAALVSLAVGPTTIKVLARLGLCQTVSEDIPERHLAKQGTPTIGGIIILVGATAGVSLAWTANYRVSAVILLTCASAALGFLDDYLIAVRGKSLGLKARQKLLGQFLLAAAFMLLIYADRTRATTVLIIGNRALIDLGWVYYPLAVFMVVGMSNAVNLADGLDGLVAGLSTILALALGALVVMAAQGGLTTLAWALAGGCVGFLWYNTNPARIFMGDTGSLALGAATAGIAVAGKQEFLYLVLGVVFVVEAVSVMIQVVSFKLTGKRVFKMTPIHHHFELTGWQEQKIVVRFWLIAGMTAAAVLYSVGVFNLWH